MQINNSVAVITGAASGIGKAAAVGLAAMGAKLVLGDRDTVQLEMITDNLRDAGYLVVCKTCNVTDELSVRELMQFAVDQWGSLNIVLACAGIIRDGFMITPDRETGKVKKILSTEHWQQVIDINLTGVFLTLREAAMQMTDNRWPGVLIPISSINKSGELGQLNYASAKVAIALWPKILAGEFHARGITNIRIAAIAPGYVATPMLTSIKPEMLEKIVADIPLGRLVSVDEILRTIQFIIENEAVHATTLEISGGIIGKGLAK